MEIKMVWEDLDALLSDKYDEGYADGKQGGVSLVMQWLESGDDLTEWLIEKGVIPKNPALERLKDFHWYRIERAIKKRCDSVGMLAVEELISSLSAGEANES